MTSYLSICSGIEAATVAWHPLGWVPLAFSEIEAFPRAVLGHHYPGVPCHGDFTALRGQPWIVDADILVGGTPCQAFSVAGLRNSLADERGNLSLEFVRLADAIDALRLAAGREPAIIVWENVPGVLSVKDNAFGCFIAAMAGGAAPYVPPGGKWTNAGVADGPARTVAWRVLDAQHFGLAQRRRRVFVVASARNGFDPAAVLLEFEGLRRDTPPRRETREVAPTIPARSLGGGGLGTDFDCDGRVIEASTGEISHCLNAGGMGRQDYETETLVTHALRAERFDASEDGTGRGTPLVPVAFSSKDHGADATEDLSPTLRAMPHHASHANGGGQMAVAVPLLEVGKRAGPLDTDGSTHALGCGSKGVQASVAVATVTGTEIMPTLTRRCDGSQTGTGNGMPIASIGMQVRRLTPVECSRLQGFPDDYLLSVTWRGKCPPPDGPMYKALGNSMAVPVMRWIGQRIAAALEAA